MDIGPAAAAAQHNARTLSPDPQSTGAAITMDGGVADTTRGYTPGRFSANKAWGNREGAVLGPGPCAQRGKRVTPQKRMIACGETR